MKIFLDTANREVIKKWASSGIIDGVTTNPSLLSQEGGNIKEVLKDICSLLPNGHVSIEVVEKEPEKVYAQALRIAEFAENVVVKIPFAPDYLSIIHKLSKAKIKLNITLTFSSLQALMVAKLNVTYISPFIGRWNDIGVNGTAILEEIVALKQNYSFSAGILAASIRSLTDWQQAMEVGADIATIPPSVFEKAMQHPLTEKGIQLFNEDWKKLGRIDFF